MPLPYRASSHRSRRVCVLTGLWTRRSSQQALFRHGGWRERRHEEAHTWDRHTTEPERIRLLLLGRRGRHGGLHNVHGQRCGGLFYRLRHVGVGVRQGNGVSCLAERDRTRYLLYRLGKGPTAKSTHARLVSSNGRWRRRRWGWWWWSRKRRGVRVGGVVCEQPEYLGVFRGTTGRREADLHRWVREYRQRAGVGTGPGAC